MKKLLFIFYLMFFNFITQAQVGWHAVPGAPAVTSGGRIDDVSFINDSVGWMVASYDTIYKTTDKGETWHAVGNASPLYVRSIEFINEQVGFMGTLQTTNDSAGLFKTSDGGVTFTRIDSLLPVPPNWGICGIAHFNNLVIAVGSVIGESKVYKSTDAGQSWALINLDSFASSLVDVFIIDSLTYLVCGESDTSTGQKAVIIRTADGGLSWTPVVYSSVFPYTISWKLFILPNGIGLASMEDFATASVFRTADYGTTWNETIISNPPFADLGGIGMLNDTLGWVGVQHNNGMYQTTDGGVTWTDINFGNSINRMVVLDSITMLAVGETVYKYGSGAVGIIEHNNLQKDAHDLKIFPNPATDKLKIELKLTTGTNVVLNLISEKGDLIQKINHTLCPKGDYQWIVDLHDYKNGNYFIHLITNEQNFGRAFQIIHE